MLALRAQCSKIVATNITCMLLTYSWRHNDGGPSTTYRIQCPAKDSSIEGLEFDILFTKAHFACWLRAFEERRKEGAKAGTQQNDKRAMMS